MMLTSFSLINSLFYFLQLLHNMMTPTFTVSVIRAFVLSPIILINVTDALYEISLVIVPR